MRLRSLLFVLPLTVAGVVACDPNNDDDNGETCEPADVGVATSYTIAFEGFPEIVGAELQSQGLAFDGTCTVDFVSFDAGQLNLELTCDHPAPSSPDGARVSITTAATGAPFGLSEGDTVDFRASAIYFENTGGDQSSGWRALQLADSEGYYLGDSVGPFFAAGVNRLAGNYDDVLTIESVANCPDWQPCGGDFDGPIRGSIAAATADETVEVAVGEVATIVGPDASWDVSLFQSRLELDCHRSEYGGFSVVRRP